VPRAPQQRSVEARPAALRAFERQTPLVVGGGGVGGSSKKSSAGFPKSGVVC
jgi:hypothetical protein